MENKLVVSLVLYQMKLSEIPSYSLLKNWLTEDSSVYLFIYDNSAEKQQDSLLEKSSVCYVHDPTNPGLAKAYNEGLTYLERIQGELLLLLDQDTLLTESYIRQLTKIKSSEEIAAYVPMVTSHGRQISPVFSQHYVGRTSKIPQPGIHAEAIMAINSGTVLTKAFLKEIGGFNEAFPLDFLDHWIFWMIREKGKAIYVFSSQLLHDLSVLDYNGMTPKRYASIIRAETYFYKTYDKKKFENYRRHLFLRIVKQFLLVKNRKIWHQTLSEFISLTKGK